MTDTSTCNGRFSEESLSSMAPYLQKALAPISLHHRSKAHRTYPDNRSNLHQIGRRDERTTSDSY